jgi:ribosomal protein L29
MSNMASQTGSLPMMGQGSNIIDKQIMDARRMGYMADGGVSDTNTMPNFYTNRLDKFVGKVKGMAARANEKSLMEDALNMAHEKNLFADGGDTSNGLFSNMDFSRATNFLNKYNDLYKAANADKLYELSNNMQSTAIMNSDPYAKFIHTYDIEKPYWKEDALPIHMPDPNKAMMPEDLMAAKYGLQTFQSDVNTGEKKSETKPMTPEELMAEIEALKKKQAELEGKKDTEGAAKKSVDISNLEARLGAMDVKDKYRWNATSKIANLLKGDTQNSGNHGQLKERTYHYEFGKPGQPAAPKTFPDTVNPKTPLGPPLTAGAPDAKKPNEKDPYDIYPDSWEGLVLPNQISAQAPLLPGQKPKLSPYPTSPVGPPMSPDVIGGNSGMPSYMIPKTPGVTTSPFNPSYPKITTSPDIYPGKPVEGLTTPMDRNAISTETGPDEWIIPNEDPAYKKSAFENRKGINYPSSSDEEWVTPNAVPEETEWIVPTMDPAYRNPSISLPEGPVRTNTYDGPQIKPWPEYSDEYSNAWTRRGLSATDYYNNKKVDKPYGDLAYIIHNLDSNGYEPEEIHNLLLMKGYSPDEILPALLNYQYNGTLPAEMKGMEPRISENGTYMTPKDITSSSLRSNMPAPGLATPKVKQRPRTTEELMAEIEELKRQEGRAPKKRNGGLAKFVKKYQGDSGSSEVFDPGMFEGFTGEDFGNSQGLDYNMTGTAQEQPAPKDNALINTAQDITMGQNFGLAKFIAPAMQFMAQRKEAAKQKKGDIMNQFSYNKLVFPTLGNNGPEDQFGNQFPTQQNFNTYYGKEGGNMYEEGGVYFLDDATIKQLKAGGAIIEYI